jgi:multidrug resistance efflux pump
MPSKRKYNIKGTNDFLVLAGIFFFLCLWAIKDAWYPSEKVQKKHPREIPVAFEVDGSVQTVHVAVGDGIGETQLLAELRDDKKKVEFETVKEEYTEAKKDYAMKEHVLNNARKNGASDGGIAELEQSLAAAKTHMDETLVQVTELRVAIDASSLKAPSKGEIKEVKIMTHTMVKAGETVMVIDPKDHFYLFNKSLAVFSFFAFWIFLAIHILAR